MLISQREAQQRILSDFFPFLQIIFSLFSIFLFVRKKGKNFATTMIIEKENLLFVKEIF
jgi:hypothetical protein